MKVLTSEHDCGFSIIDFEILNLCSSEWRQNSLILLFVDIVVSFKPKFEVTYSTRDIGPFSVKKKHEISLEMDISQLYPEAWKCPSVLCVCGLALNKTAKQIRQLLLQPQVKR